MRRAILRSFAVAGCVVLVAVVSRFIEFLGFCEEHQAYERAHANGDVLDKLPTGGYAIARPHDEIVVCWTRHCVGPPFLPVVCHSDVGCWCTPADGDPDEATIASRLDRTPGNVRCQVDKPHPRPDDEGGVCPHAHCLGHIDPLP
jgi:hypothetical protein